MSTAAIERVQYSGLEMAFSPAEAKRRVQELQAFVQEAMFKDTDFGLIPGTDKPTLYQQGAQKLAEIYGLAHRFEWIEVVKDWERPFFYFEVRCILTSRRDGAEVGHGIGSCNSKESKYAYRWAYKSDVPPHLDKSKLVQKTRKSKKPPHQDYTVYRVDNDDMASQVNTLQKMACKRAYVHAVISVTRSSGLFTQDAEDLPEEAFGVVEEERPWERSSAQEVTRADIYAEQLAAIEREGTLEQWKECTGKITLDITLNLEEKLRLKGLADKADKAIGLRMLKPKAKTAEEIATEAEPRQRDPLPTDPPFGKSERAGQKNPPPSPEPSAKPETPSGQPASAPPSVDWRSEVDKMKELIAKAFEQAESAPKTAVKAMVHRFVSGPPFPPAELADELTRFLKMTSGEKGEAKK